MKAGSCSAGCWAAGDNTLKTRTNTGSCAASVSQSSSTAAGGAGAEFPHFRQTAAAHPPEGDRTLGRHAAHGPRECTRLGPSGLMTAAETKKISSEEYGKTNTPADKTRTFYSREKSFAGFPENPSNTSEKIKIADRCQSSPFSTASRAEEKPGAVGAQVELKTDKETLENNKDAVTKVKTEAGRVKVEVEEFRRLLYVQMCKSKNPSDLFIEVNSVEVTQAALQKYDVDMDKLGSVYPSVGALLHDEGYCIPCAFASKNNKSCHNGVSCCFCHYFHREVLVRRRGKKKRGHNHGGGANQRSEAV